MMAVKQRDGQEELLWSCALIKYMQIRGGWVGGVLTAISGVDPQGKVRNAESEGGGAVAHIWLSASRDEWLGGQQGISSWAEDDPIVLPWQPATLARPLPAPLHPHLLPAPVGKRDSRWEVPKRIKPGWCFHGWCSSAPVVNPVWPLTLNSTQTLQHSQNSSSSRYSWCGFITHLTDEEQTKRSPGAAPDRKLDQDQRNKPFALHTRPLPPQAAPAQLEKPQTVVVPFPLDHDCQV